MQNGIVIEPITEHNFGDLAVLLTCDETLLQSLGSGQRSRTATSSELFEDIEKWQMDNNANSYTIRLDNKSIGLISLSHQKSTYAQVGYWLASSEWNKGYTTEAFAQLIEIAKQCGFTQLSATIDPSNTASKRIWEKLGASFRICNDELIALLEI
ncbi:GNAT family N-acetyltransferase [Candidatus Saccharibacteria bacterium]|nr:GNAT family N-acetyltransferase [Candidatus Saccharibacteria bacterium]